MAYASKSCAASDIFICTSCMMKTPAIDMISIMQQMSTTLIVQVSYNEQARAKETRWV